jgi:TonB family protein
MIVHRIGKLFVLGLSILWIGSPGDAAAQARQSQAAFETAIRDTSTSPYVVLITVVDDRTGEVSTGCNTANLLLGAIYLEKWGSFDSSQAAARHEEVKRIALENTSHTFHFSNQAALNNVLPFRFAEACVAIERGTRARIADRTGQILFGPFVEGPRIVRSGCSPPADPKPGEGSTTVAIMIGQDGSIKESKITDSSGSKHWDEAVLAALLACKFSPRTIDGEPDPEPTWMRIMIGSRARWNF